MYIKKLDLVNYRNYIDLNIELNKKFNIFYGKNAQGKTNILEAVFLCSSGRSHRTAKDSEMLKFQEDFFHVTISVQKEYGENTVEIFFSNDNGKTININSNPIRKKGELMGVLNTVLFSPEDLDIIKGSPAVRRRFIDIAISQIKPSYFYSLQQYLKILKERNFLLKSLREKKDLINTLDIWNEKLAEEASKIIYERIGFIDSINDIIREKHKMLTDGEVVKLKYLPSFVFSEIQEKNDIRTIFLAKLNATFERDLIYQSTLIGPQRDDVAVEIDGKCAKQFGSQGQQRTAVLSLKLSEVQLIFDVTGEKPVLLLDDVFSELDDSRRNHLMSNMDDIQVFITTTNKESFKKPETINDISYFNVVEGMVYNI